MNKINIDRNMEDDEFKQRVKEDLEEIKGNLGLNQDGDLFTIWFGINILSLDERDVFEDFFIGGSGDDKIDLGIISSDRNLNIISQCKYQETFNKDLIDEVCNACDRIDKSPDSGNNKRKKFVNDLSLSSKPLKLIAVCFGRTKDKNVYDYAIKKGVDIYDFDRLKREYINNLATELKIPESIKLSISEGKIEYNKGKIESIFFILPIWQLFDPIDKYQNGFFSENLRYKLKNKASDEIAKSIQETIKAIPENFIILNNGITLTCENIIKDGQDDNQLTFVRPQIVNGCQTSYAIYDSIDIMNKAGRDIKEIRAYLWVKAVKTIDEKFRKNVTKSTNTQNPITKKDLRSDNQHQKELIIGFKEYKDYNNKVCRIFFDMMEGSWENIKQNKKDADYKVSGNSRKGTYRILDNSLMGQLRLALMGLPYLCKNQKGIIFDDDKYFNAIFNFENPNLEDIEVNSDEAQIKSGRNEWVEDTIFAYCIYQVAKTLICLYKQKMKLYTESEYNTQDYQNINKKEFVEYWQFYLVRLIHFIIERKSNKDNQKRNELRKKLLGNNINIFFETQSKIAKKFNIDNNKSKYTILDVDNPSQDFSLLGRWIVRLEQEVYNKVDEAMSKDWKSSNQYFEKRADTIKELTDRMVTILGGADDKLFFPEELKNKS